MEEKKEEILDLNESEPKRRSLFSRLRTKRKQRKNERIEKSNAELTAEVSKAVEEKLEEVNKEIAESKSKKTKKRNIIFWIFNLILILGILLWNVLSTNDFTPFVMLELDYSYVLVALLLLVGMVLMDVLSVHRMIYQKTGRSRWASSYKSVSIYRFTPLVTGGQPFMVSYLTGRDIPATTALSIPITKLLFQSLAWLVLTTICLIYSFTQEMATFISALSIIGFILTLLIVVFIIFSAISKKGSAKIVGGIIKLLVKMRLLKDYDKHYTRVINFLDDYQKVMKEYTKEVFDIIYQFLLSAIRYIMMFSIPFFIYSAFKGYDPNMFGEFFVYTALIDLASHVIPLPNGAGVYEITFAWLFSRYLGGTTFWALLMWRFCTFYFYILQGICVIAYDSIYGNRKYRWIKKKLELQNESQEFRRTQIENFRRTREKRRKKQSDT